MTEVNQQNPLVKEFIALGKKYESEIKRLERENDELRENMLDFIAFRDTRNEETFPATVVRALIGGANPVKAFREYRELSQMDLSEKSGVPQNVISGIENGKRKGTVENFKALAQALGLDIDDLV